MSKRIFTYMEDRPTPEVGDAHKVGIVTRVFRKIQPTYSDESLWRVSEKWVKENPGTVPVDKISYFESLVKKLKHLWNNDQRQIFAETKSLHRLLLADKKAQEQANKTVYVEVESDWDDSYRPEEPDLTETAIEVLKKKGLL